MSVKPDPCPTRMRRPRRFNAAGTAFHRSLARSEVLSLATTTAWDPIEPQATRPLAFTEHSGDAPATYFHTHDLTKNVCELIDSNGAAVSACDCAPFGAVAISGTPTRNPFQFSSEVYDPETALVYCNYRHYNPIDGRWISRDPAGEASLLNLYAIVKNRPLYSNDALGLGFSDRLSCLGECIADNDVLNKLNDYLATKLILLFAGGGIPKRFVVYLSAVFLNDRCTSALREMNLNIPSTMLAWKPIKILFEKVLRMNAPQTIKSITKTAVPVTIVYGNVMAVIEAECCIYCCKHDVYNPEMGLEYFNADRALDYYFGNMTWKDFGYDDAVKLP